jgi:hypothetical protein
MGPRTNLIAEYFGSFGIKTVTADFSNLDEVRAKRIRSQAQSPDR